MVHTVVYFAAGITNIKAKVLKDGHLFVVHILDPQLEMGEEIPEIPMPDVDPEWPQSFTEMVSEQNSGKPSAIVVAGYWFISSILCQSHHYNYMVRHNYWIDPLSACTSGLMG